MLFLQAVLIIFHKFGQTLVGQLVVDEFLQDLRMLAAMICVGRL